MMNRKFRVHQITVYSLINEKFSKNIKIAEIYLRMFSFCETPSSAVASISNKGK
jgi:hypothetical protein